MVYFTDAQVYLDQSILLLQARPTTTRISTRYTLAPVPSKASQASTKPSANSSTSTPSSTPRRPRGYLILKTYDPASGACLKYRTTKQAEVGRLIAGLGRCARVMAAVPAVAEEAGTEGEKEAMAGQAPAQGGPAPAQAPATSEQKPGASGGGKKKKKGKK